MLLSITNLTSPATDLGYLLHKHPDKMQSYSVSFGQVHVFYPQADEHRCTASLLLEIDPIALVRNRRGPAGEGHSLEQYVNDRPYVASSFMSVAISEVFGTALAGNCKAKPDLVDQPLSLEVNLEVLPARGGGETIIRKLFEPLGYQVQAIGYPLDAKFDQWGQSPYFSVLLRNQIPLKELLNHLYVLIPVLDNNKHYWVGDDEVEKLLSKGETWLAKHPEREQITTRYLRHQRHLTRQALARLTADDQPDPDAVVQSQDQQEEAVERPLSLNDQRHAAVLAALKSCGARRVMDLGCAQGKLLGALLHHKQFERIVGLDVSLNALEIAEQRLSLDRLPDNQRKRIELLHGSLLYRDNRLKDFDAACLVEVIEHMDPMRLAALERTVFEFARPQTVIVTTPNIQYNVRFETLPAGKLRHKDHRFEWTRQQFADWANAVAGRHGYSVDFMPVGPVDPEVGSPTQMGVFKR